MAKRPDIDHEIASAVRSCVEVQRKLKLHPSSPGANVITAAIERDQRAKVYRCALERTRTHARTARAGVVWDQVVRTTGAARRRRKR